MTKLIFEVPDKKIQMVNDLLNATGVKHSSLPKIRINKEALTRVSLWTEKDIHAIETVSKSMETLSIKEW